MPELRKQLERLPIREEEPAGSDKLLFTPGPLTTSLTVKQAMLHDAGSWHHEFNQVVAGIRNRLLHIAGVSRDQGWEVIPLQGSGTFGVEAVFQTCVPCTGHVAVLANGAYGERIIQMLQWARIPCTPLRFPEDTPVNPFDLDHLLVEHDDITHVAAVHCETTTGILNPIQELGHVVNHHRRQFVVDAMSSFGALPLDFEECHIDYLISSANKCLEGVPGFSFVFCRRERLEESEGHARSLSLDLLSQWRGFQANGQFRYTPPTHALLAFAQALDELDAEGGPGGRLQRYQRNHSILIDGMKSLGFRPYLDSRNQSCIITAFHFPPDPAFEFKPFYQSLSDQGFIIYPGKLSQADTFRIGTIGRLHDQDIHALIRAIEKAISQLGIQMDGGGNPSKGRKVCA